MKKHEHFVDRYHINEKISKVYKELPQDLKHSLFTSISDANKELFNALLTTTEALIANEKDENELEAFIEFSDYLRSIFCYIIPANKRGLDIIECIGIMESQQRQISYRMKHKGMYWSESGARRMAKMIISVSQETFRELFFGNWREEFDKYTMYEDVTAELIFQALHEETEPTYYGKIANENIRKFINMLS